MQKKGLTIILVVLVAVVAYLAYSGSIGSQGAGYTSLRLASGEPSTVEFNTQTAKKFRNINCSEFNLNSFVNFTSEEKAKEVFFAGVHCLNTKQATLDTLVTERQRGGLSREITLDTSKQLKSADRKELRELLANDELYGKIVEDIQYLDIALVLYAQDGAFRNSSLQYLDDYILAR